MSSANEIDAMITTGLEGGDDPRITTYALGEMEPAERAAFEAELLTRPELKQEVDRVRRLARLIEGELHADVAPVAGLPADVKARVVGAPVAGAPAASAAKAGAVIRAPGRWSPWVEVATAAGLLGIVGVGAVTKFKSALGNAHSASTSKIDTDIAATINGEYSDDELTSAQIRLRGTDTVATVTATTEAAAPADPRTLEERGWTTQTLGKPLEFASRAKLPPAHATDKPTTERPPSTEAAPRGEVAEGQVATLALGDKAATPEELAQLRLELARRKAADQAHTAVLGTGAVAPPSTTPTTETPAPPVTVFVAGKAGDADKEKDVKEVLERLSYAVTEGELDKATKDKVGRAVERARQLQERGDAAKAVELLEQAVAMAGGDPRRSPDLAPSADNPFKKASEENTGTFSIDVDTAGFATVRSSIERGAWPNAASVRIEELLNYFPYSYAPPTDGKPFASNVEVTACPWQPKNRLVRIGIKGKEIDRDARPVSNLVFLIDVSGSMQEPQKLPLLKQSLIAMVDNLSEKDRVAIVVYAGASGLVLPSTTGDRKQEIIAALDQLQAGGGTNGGAGLELAYKVARENFITGGTNRVVLCTDGDWNVGLTGPDAIERFVVDKAKSGVFLTCLGFFGSNYQDQTMERMADKGNGNYAGIDSLREAKKVLVEEMSGTLVTIAKDVKVQVEFNKEKVRSYRLIGYENRVLANQDFADDTKDAGEIGAGHCVTALYEVEPTGPAVGGELLTLRLRWKKPDGQTSELQETKVEDSDKGLGQASVDTRFAASVAAWGMLLRSSPHRGTATFGLVEELGSDALGKDPGGHRAAWLELVQKSKALQKR